MGRAETWRLKAFHILELANRGDCLKNFREEGEKTVWQSFPSTLYQIFTLREQHTQAPVSKFLHYNRLTNPVKKESSQNSISHETTALGPP